MGLRRTHDNENAPGTPSSPSRAASVNERYPTPTCSDFQRSAHEPRLCGADLPVCG
jgi:hypothetical protein